MGRKSFSGHLSRCYRNICRRSRKVVAVLLVVSAVGLAIVGIQEEHREVDTAEQQIVTLTSPLSASGNSTATVTTFKAGWWGHRLVMADLFENQMAARGLTLRLK